MSAHRAVYMQKQFPNQSADDGNVYSGAGIRLLFPRETNKAWQVQHVQSNLNYLYHYACD